MLKAGRSAARNGIDQALVERRTPPFDELYREHSATVRRFIRWFGVEECAVDDVSQQVFIVVYRRLPDFGHVSSIRTWIFGIVRRVVSDYRKSRRCKSLFGALPLRDPATVPDDRRLGPDEVAERAEATRVFQGWLRQLKVKKRLVFVLAEVEQMTTREIAGLVGANHRTVQWRLRTARIDLEKAAQRWRQRDARRLRRPDR